MATLPPLVDMCQKANAHIQVVADASSPSGVLGNILEQDEFEKLLKILHEINSNNAFDIQIEKHNKKETRTFNRKQFGKCLNETHCFRGYPIVGSIKQFFESDSEYVLHIDCDMLFYEEKNISWILQAISIMEQNPDLLCILPKGGPPTPDGSLHQGSTTYSTDNERGIYLFKNFTSRYYLIHKKRFLDLLPLKPIWLSWREPIKSQFLGKGKMLCWESMVERALEKSDLRRADLLTNQAWSLHLGDRSGQFYQLLPQIINSVKLNKFPDEQRGHFDLRLNHWKDFLN